MHPNPVFRQTPTMQSLAFVRARGFGILSVNGADGPLLAHKIAAQMRAVDGV